jgi:ferritin-like protein
MARVTNRRELIDGALGLTAAAAMATAVASGTAEAAVGSETDALENALRLERVAVVCYRQVLSRNVLSAGVTTPVRLLLGQELQHVSKLEHALARLGAPVPPGPGHLAGAQAVLLQHGVSGSLTDLPTQHDALKLLIDVESLTEGAYFSAIPQLQHPALIRISVEMMGSDAQHWTTLSGLQHHGDVMLSVPYPFVQGSP